MTVEALRAPLSYTHEVFVSYGHEDQQWVRETLLPRLVGAGIDAISDLQSESGMLVPVWISAHAPHCRHIVCVMSPDWVSSPWSEIEASFGIGRADETRHVALLPILLKPCNIPLLVANYIYRDLSALQGPLYEDEFARLIRTIIESRDLGKATPSPADTQPVKAEPAVHALLQLEEVLRHEAVRPSMKNTHWSRLFRSASEDIKRLADFKDVHDQLHKLQIEFQRVVLTDLAAGNRFAYKLYRMVLKAVIAEIREVRTRMTTDDFRWIEQLEQADTLFGMALTQGDEGKAADALLLIETVLQRHTASVNSGVISSVNSLRLDDLVEAVKNLCRDASTSAGVEFEQLRNGVAALALLAGNLHDLVREHGEWQSVDSDLRFIDRLLEIPLILALAESQVPVASNSDASGNMNVIGMMWPGACAAVADLARTDESWLKILDDQKQGIEEALATGNMSLLRDNYSLYRRVTVERFFKVDRSLKHQCDELRLVGTQLDLVSRSLHD